MNKLLELTKADEIHHLYAKEIRRIGDLPEEEVLLGFIRYRLSSMYHVYNIVIDAYNGKHPIKYHIRTKDLIAPVSKLVTLGMEVRSPELSYIAGVNCTINDEFKNYLLTLEYDIEDIRTGLDEDVLTELGIDIKSIVFDDFTRKASLFPSMVTELPSGYVNFFHEITDTYSNQELKDYIGAIKGPFEDVLKSYQMDGPFSTEFCDAVQSLKFCSGVQGVSEDVLINIFNTRVTVKGFNSMITNENIYTIEPFVWIEK